MLSKCSSVAAIFKQMILLFLNNVVNYGWIYHYAEFYKDIILQYGVVICSFQNTFRLIERKTMH